MKSKNNKNNNDRLLFGISLFILGVSIGVFFTRGVNSIDIPSAIGQQGRPVSAGGIMAFTGQITKDDYGIIMVDVDAGTIWLYQYQKPGNQLKLLAARSWLYDRYLEDYNCASPKPSEISQLIANLQQKKQSETLESNTEK